MNHHIESCSNGTYLRNIREKLCENISLDCSLSLTVTFCVALSVVPQICKQ